MLIEVRNPIGELVTENEVSRGDLGMIEFAVEVLTRPEMSGLDEVSKVRVCDVMVNSILHANLPRNAAGTPMIQTVAMFCRNNGLDLTAGELIKAGKATHQAFQARHNKRNHNTLIESIRGKLIKALAYDESDFDLILGAFDES